MSTEIPELESAVAQYAEGMATASEALNMAGAAATSYRNYLLEQGWPREMVDQVAGLALVRLQQVVLGIS